jgi:hypothetical protein
MRSFYQKGDTCERPIRAGMTGGLHVRPLEPFMDHSVQVGVKTFDAADRLVN